MYLMYTTHTILNLFYFYIHFIVLQRFHKLQIIHSSKNHTPSQCSSTQPLKRGITSPKLAISHTQRCSSRGGKLCQEQDTMLTTYNDVIEGISWQFNTRREMFLKWHSTSAIQSLTWRPSACEIVVSCYAYKTGLLWPVYATQDLWLVTCVTQDTRESKHGLWLWHFTKDFWVNL